jgi:hypothetical protein
MVWQGGVAVDIWQGQRSEAQQGRLSGLQVHSLWPTLGQALWWAQSVNEMAHDRCPQDASALWAEKGCNGQTLGGLLGFREW